MPRTRNRGAAVAVATLGLLLNGALVGYSSSKDDTKQDTSSAAEQSPTPTPTEQSSESPSETPSATPTPSSSTAATRAANPEAALLAAGDLPPLSPSSPWHEGRTTAPGPTSFGACQRFDLLSIGATSVVERSFSAGSGDTAGQQVAEFPDAQNTVRAGKVLEAWHDRCKGQVKGSNVHVGPITAGSVPQGKAWWYSVSWNRGGTGHVHSFGMVFNGNRMTLLKMDHAGQDHDYPPGQDPMERAVNVASAKM